MAVEPWLRLALAASSGSRRWHELLREHGGAAVVGALSATALRDAGITAAEIDALRNPEPRQLEQARTWLAEPSRMLIGIDDPAYPPLLRAIGDAPLALWVEGSDIARLSAPQLAIVGSRNPTRGGRETASSFAHYLSEHGLTITSGIAAGIDAASHEGALLGGAGTIAVLGSGPDTIYPRANSSLARRIVADGLLVSEFPPGTPPRAQHFPQRNRVIAALSVGTLVVEAARRSGSLITARCAADYGREVFAIPGSIHNPLAKGCHQLIRQGAKLVDDVADILVELAPLLALEPAAPRDMPALEKQNVALTEQAAYRELLDVLGYEPVAFTTLAQRTRLTTAELSSMLLLLEFEGLVEALPGGRYSRLSQRGQ
ncbi:MAG TPA: DNA-processing protein DprA [Gammaproteobacteria bacterium]|nr:DNA-processing protein DprA [Gammaproteobacteria bacterium]